MRRFLSGCLLLLIATCSASPGEPAVGDLQLFLLIGQSNMAGRGRVEDQDRRPDPRVMMLTRDLTWTPAADPVHFDKEIAGTGLCSQFARTLIAADPSLRIGLIPCAMGGSSLDQWQPDGALYANAVRRSREALKRGRLAGILWHQGESDCEPALLATYEKRFATLVARLREDLGASDTPVVIGELGHFFVPGKAFNQALPGIARRVPHCGLATAEGLVDKGDKLHFDAASLRQYGQRYAEVHLRLRKVGQPAVRDP
jgi:hypothetical protein